MRTPLPRIVEASLAVPPAGLSQGSAGSVAHAIVDRMVARLQQCIVLAWLLAAAAWTSGWWSHAPGVALGGLLILSLAHAAFLALEFIASYHVSRRDPLGRATAMQCARAWAAESRTALRVFCWQQPFRSHAVPDHLPMS